MERPTTTLSKAPLQKQSKPAQNTVFWYNCKNMPSKKVTSNTMTV